MKKTSVEVIAKSRAESVEKFQPLYLLASEDPEPSKQIHIFINSSKKSCYIQEKRVWREIIINHSLVGFQKETYYFQAKNRYHYLEMDHQDAYFALVGSDRKISLKNLALSKEIFQELSVPNLEQLNTSTIANTQLEAEKILKLTRRITRVNEEIIRLKKALLVLTDARPVMERLDNNKKEKFTLVDLDDQIKLVKRQKHYNEYVKLKAQIKIQILLTIDKQVTLKDYETNLQELSFQKKEITRSLHDQQLAITKLEKVAECFADLNSASCDVLIIEQINAQIKLIDKNLKMNRLRLKKIEEEIKVLIKPEDRENTKMVNTKSSLFNNVIKPNSTQCREADLKKAYSLNLV